MRLGGSCRAIAPSSRQSWSRGGCRAEAGRYSRVASRHRHCSRPTHVRFNEQYKSEKDTVAAALALRSSRDPLGDAAVRTPVFGSEHDVTSTAARRHSSLSTRRRHYVRRALKAASMTMVDERTRTRFFDLELPAPGVMQAYAFQLDSTPDPWLAAGGKDSSSPSSRRYAEKARLPNRLR